MKSGARRTALQDAGVWALHLVNAMAHVGINGTNKTDGADNVLPDLE
jgi:hypothetical protein